MASHGVGLEVLDRLTHNVRRGNMNVWSGFSRNIGNFREIRYFDIEGKLTGLVSRAMTAPCGKIRIPINESSDDKSQIEEFIRQYKGGRYPAYCFDHRKYLRNSTHFACPWH